MDISNKLQQDAKEKSPILIKFSGNTIYSRSAQFAKAPFSICTTLSFIL